MDSYCETFSGKGLDVFASTFGLKRKGRTDKEFREFLKIIFDAPKMITKTDIENFIGQYFSHFEILTVNQVSSMEPGRLVILIKDPIPRFFSLFDDFKRKLTKMHREMKDKIPLGIEVQIYCITKEL